MRRFVCILCMFLTALSGTPAFATTRYVAQTAGLFSGGTACNGQTATTVATWNSTAESAGDVTYVCGTITGTAGATGMVIGWSGASGNPIQIIFDTGAVLTAPYWAGGEYGAAGGAIQCVNHSYITINGDANGARQGIIENSANGTGRTYQQDSVGIMLWGCSHATVENVTVENIYVSTDGDPSGTGVDIFSQEGDSILLTNFSAAYAYTPVNIGYDTSAPITSAVVSNSSIDYGCHLLDIGDANANSTASGIVVSGNLIGPHTEAFNESTGNCHQDGIFLQAENSGSTISASVYNNWIKSDMCSNRGATGLNCTSPNFFSGAIINTTYFNNIVQFVASQGGYEGMFVLRADQPQHTLAFYNNTIDQNNAGSGQSCDCSMVKMDGASASQSGITFKNNIFLNDGGHGVYYNNNSGTGSVTFATLFSAVNNNDYYGITGNYGYDNVNSQAYSTWSAWQSSNPINNFPSYDAAGSDATPNVTVSYVPVVPSAAIGLAANLTSLSIAALDSDYAGNGRPSSGSWTAGALNQAAAVPPSAPSPQSFVFNAHFHRAMGD